MSVCLGYNNIKYQDGSGAQLQRILSIRALSKYLGLNFFNSKILDIDFNPGDGIDSLQKKTEYLTKLNAFINLPDSCQASPHYSGVIPSGRCTGGAIRLMVYFKLFSLWAFLSRKHIHVALSNPERWISKKPNILNKLDFNPNDNMSKKDEGKILISLHIQRAKNSNFQLSDRYQPTTWYKVLLDAITETLEDHGIDYLIDLHTDAPEVPKIWTLGNAVSSKTAEYWMRGGFIGAQGNAILGAEDFFTSLNRTSDLMRIHRDIDPLEAWKLMARSKVIITGKSSFSFIGGLLSRNSLVISPKYFNRGPDSWLLLDDSPSKSDLIEVKKRLVQCLD